nr:hypothetical protein [Micromonospora purpureochromogenes]
MVFHECPLCDLAVAEGNGRELVRREHAAVEDEEHLVALVWPRSPVDRKKSTDRDSEAQLGVPPHVVQAIARHADVKLTLKVYSHANLDAMRQALGKLDGRLS